MVTKPESTAADVRRVFASTLKIIIVSVLWTIFLPGAVAMWGDVFYSEGIRLPSYGEARLKPYNDAQNLQSEQQKKIDATLIAAVERNDAELIKALLLYRDDLAKRNADPAPVATVGFHLNPQLLMWPAIYSCLAWLIFVFPPQSNERQPRREGLFSLGATGSPRFIPLFALLIYATYEWPTWIRNLLPRDTSRKVFAYPNWDIHWPSFVVQELVVFGFATLVAILWLQWTDYYAQKAYATEHHEARRRRKNDREQSEESLEEALDSDLVNDVASMYGEWQVRSVILALGFVFFTNFFWTLVGKYHDQRYLVSAIMVHVLWGMSWTTITIPLIMRWRYWLRVRRAALVDLATYDRKGDEEAKREIVAATKPFSDFGFSLAGIASLASFFLPILKAFL